MTSGEALWAELKKKNNPAVLGEQENFGFLGRSQSYFC
jgi:hypothetical protein